MVATQKKDASKPTTKPKPKTTIKTILNINKKKVKIPLALREQVWIQKMGKVFEGKCTTIWCSNKISVFDFECGHNIPESKGGPTIIENLVPICTRCNRSMSNTYTFQEWCDKHCQEMKKTSFISKLFSCIQL
jgi:5-methylcytosine-specific restriction endonuclease McrA